MIEIAVHNRYLRYYAVSGMLSVFEERFYAKQNQGLIVFEVEWIRGMLEDYLKAPSTVTKGMIKEIAQELC